MKIVAISDTHGAHGRLTVPPCDVLVCAGDYTRRGTEDEVRRFVAWFAEQPGVKILVGGNHDTWSETHPDEMARLVRDRGITWLVGETASVAGLRVFGSPMTPAWRSMAFNRVRGPPLAEHWAAIPADLDLLVTHGPPAGIGDRAVLGSVGCADLRAAVLARPPRVHLFGHIHEAHGRYTIPGVRTAFYNVANRGLLPLGVRSPTELTVAT